MRALGYPRLISLENFRTSNFELVADILFWLVHHYDPDSDISDEIEEEHSRVEFIKSVAKFFLSKSRIKLNMKKLYQADGFAVQEMLKVATLLYQAMNSNQGEDEDSSLDFGASSKLQSVKSARGLASEITESGAKLYDLLGREKDLREARDKALTFLDNITRNLDSNAEQDYIRKCIRDIMQEQTQSLFTMEKMLADLEKDEQTLDTKIKKKATELERAEKRAKALQTVRPAYMDEYDRLEQELEKMFEAYVLKVRNLSFLEHELEIYHAKDMQRAEEAKKNLEDDRKKIVEAEQRLLRGEQEDIDEAGLEGEEEDDDEEMEDDGRNQPSRPAARSGNRDAGARHRPAAQEEGSGSEQLIDDVEDDESGSMQGEMEGQMESDDDNEF
jgi:clusterin-associated protein 1